VFTADWLQPCYSLKIRGPALREKHTGLRSPVLHAKESIFPFEHGAVLRASPQSALSFAGPSFSVRSRNPLRGFEIRKKDAETHRQHEKGWQRFFKRVAHLEMHGHSAAH
jgi:hypothetical protein